MYPDKMSGFSFSNFSRLKIAEGLLIGLLIFLFPAMAVEPEEKATYEATFIPQWIPQAQFAGYYVAYEHRLYRKYGINLTILAGGPEREPSDFLKDHRADFSSLWLSSAIKLRTEGLPIVNIAQIMQRSALMLVAKKSSGIRKPEDMNGKKVGLWESVFRFQPQAFFRQYNLRVKIIPQSRSVDLFLRGGVDVASAMWYNEYHTILNSGLNPDELTTFFFHEHGLNFPEDGIYTLEETYRKNPRLCEAFVRASIEGWEYAFAHPEETLDLLMEYLKKQHVPATRIHQKWMLERMKDLIFPEEDSVPIGTMKLRDYKKVAQALKEQGLIEKIPAFSSFHRKCGANEK
jgi:NitT/TauT family transport system substrate-binding protein